MANRMRSVLDQPEAMRAQAALSAHDGCASFRRSKRFAGLMVRGQSTVFLRLTDWLKALETAEAA